MVTQSCLLTKSEKQEPAPGTNMSPYFRLHDEQVRLGGAGKVGVRTVSLFLCLPGIDTHLPCLSLDMAMILFLI